jgi:protein-S-isoprenylcysteine O-methyltransferase Ste14
MKLMIILSREKTVEQRKDKRTSRNLRSWQPFWVAIAFIVLVGFIFFMMMKYMGDSTDDFLKVWAAVGPIVGVLTGLIPMYFFHNTMQDLMQDSSVRAAKNAAEDRREKDGYAESPQPEK